MFHGTSIDNVESIKEKGILSKFEGVYLTSSLDSACRWVAFKLKAMGQRKFAVIEVEIEKSKLEEGCDHSPLMVQLFGVGDSKLSSESIPPENIKEIHLFEIAEKNSKKAS